MLFNGIAGVKLVAEQCEADLVRVKAAYYCSRLSTHYAQSVLNLRCRLGTLHLYKFAFCTPYYAKIPSDELFVSFSRRKRKKKKLTL